MIRGLLDDLGVGLLVLARVLAMIQVAPLLSSSAIPQVGKIGLAVFVALIALPGVVAAGYPLPSSGMQYGLLLLGEALLGALLGFLVYLAFAALRLAGQFISLSVGFGVAELFDPLSGHQSPLLGQMFSLLALLVFLASLALTAVYGYIVSFFGQDILAPEPLPGELTETVLQRMAGFFIIVLLAPFAEEVFFRGFLLPAFANRWGFLAGAIITSGLFGISHVAPGAIVPAFMSGMLFAWLYHRTGSLWNTTIAHGAQNALAFAVTTPV